MKVRKESIELEDWFAERDSTKLQKELEEDRRREEYEQKQIQQRRAQLVAEEHRRFLDRWMAYALGLGKPWDSPSDYPLLVKSEIHAVLCEIESNQNDSVVRELVDAAILRAICPWRVAEAKRQARQRGIESALSTLPLEMRWNADWSARAKKTALDAADNCRDDADANDIASAVKDAIQPLLAEHRHHFRIRNVAQEFMVLPDGTFSERGEARAVVEAALAGLPIGASDRAIEEAKQEALAPFRDFEPGESPFDIDRRTRGSVEQTLCGELDDSESEDHVRRRVRQIMKKVERCE